MTRVKLFASFQEITGVNQVELEFEDVREMLNKVVDRFPDLEGEIFTSPQRHELRPRVKVMVNGRNMDFMDGLDTRILENDRVAVFPPVGGG